MKSELGIKVWFLKKIVCKFTKKNYMYICVILVMKCVSSEVNEPHTLGFRPGLTKLGCMYSNMIPRGLKFQLDEGEELYHLFNKK